MMRTTRHTTWMALAILIGIGFASAPLSAQIPDGVEGAFQPHKEAEKAISGLLSPYCPGLMLEVCPSATAAALRDSIQALALQGRTSKELVAWMLGNHGEKYRAIPERSGAALWAWLMPPLAILFGLLSVILVVRRLRGAPRTVQGGAGGPDPGAGAPEGLPLRPR